MNQDERDAAATSGGQGAGAAAGAAGGAGAGAGAPRFRQYAHELTQIVSHRELFSPAECARIVAAFGAEPFAAGEVGDENALGVRDAWRRSRVRIIQPGEDSIHIMQRLQEIVVAANQRYEFDIDLFEAVQIARYDADERGHYVWHKDLGAGMMQYRKLSLTVQLSASNDYEGGNLEIDRGPEVYVAPREQGSVTLFPSFERHRVTEVTRGTRWSLVAWAAGTTRLR